jgi:hypothetical protein
VKRLREDDWRANAGYGWVQLGLVDSGILTEYVFLCSCHDYQVLAEFNKKTPLSRLKSC